MVASNNDDISQVILLGSYPIKDVTDKEVIIITAEHDEGMDPVSFEESLQFVNDETYFIYNIVGGNHAQFGWYGPQKGDGEAEISTIDSVFALASYFLKYNLPSCVLIAISPNSSWAIVGIRPATALRRSLIVVDISMPSLYKTYVGLECSTV